MTTESAEQEADRMGYDLDSLRAQIDKRKATIKIFEQAIQGERDGIELDQRMIAHLERDS